MIEAALGGADPAGERLDPDGAFAPFGQKAKAGGDPGGRPVLCLSGHSETITYLFVCFVIDPEVIDVAANVVPVSKDTYTYVIFIVWLGVAKLAGDFQASQRIAGSARHPYVPAASGP